MAETGVKERVREIQRRILDACNRAGRDPSTVKLLGASKSQPASRIKEAYDAGVRCFGENRLQELLEKAPLLPKDIEWHFIGRLQRRKVAKVLPLVSLIHSLDSLELAQEIEKRTSALSLTSRCLIEVNVDGEPQKGGIDLENVGEFIRTINQFSSLIPVGLMCIPREGGERLPFRTLKQLGEKFRKDFSSSTVELSMGMSEDFEIAIEEGSTIVRIGEGLFGPRS